MENKTGKYFKYAIGEIVLVVIGILIALQINNWNNNRIERRMEKEILKEILVNLETDLQNINETIERNKIWIEHNYLVVEHLENKTPLTDSLKYHYSSLYGYHRFQPIKVAYENLKSEGISIIRNNTLRKKISELYEYQYFFMVEDIRTEIGRIQPIHKNQIITKLKTEQSYVSAQPVNLVALQNDIPFHETLKDVIVYRWWTIGRIKKGREKIIEVISAIENELDKN
ncbi:DUF6090 family protein [Muriicola sp. SD30]|uniref:DUF6090 family protein n=1 Tax=Muriicola sp. SD30 TaxID=3240936 RepID=UPI0035104916